MGIPLDHLEVGGGVAESISHTSSKGMPRHAHWRCALIVVGGRQLKCCEISVMCKFHIKTYHMSNSQNCWSLFLIFSSFVRVCVSAYVVKKHALLCLRTVASYFYLALTLKVHCRCIVDLRKFTRRNLSWQVKVYMQGHTKQSYMCGKAQNPSHENKEAVLASTFSSPPMGGDENVLKCFLLTEFNNNFDSYQKKVLDRRCCTRKLQFRVIGFIECIPMSFQRDICSTYTSRARSSLTFKTS